MREPSESQRRLYETLCSALGENILNWLTDSNINEVMLNPDGQLWIDTRSGLFAQGFLTVAQAYGIVNGVAGIHEFVVSQHHPRLEAELPHYNNMRGERFTAAVPPIVAKPCFTIRKRSEIIFSLQDYVESERASLEQVAVLRELVKTRKNILVCGGPGSGKTTMTNALILEAIKTDPQQRFLILEDLPELQCAAPNCVPMLTCETASMRDLLHAAMRMRPDRILIGEVRGAEALDMLKAWNTGCPGGICTTHANGAEEAVQRIADLAMEAGLSQPPWSLLLHTLNAIVSIVRREHNNGFVHQIVSLQGKTNEKFLFQKLA